MSNNNNEFVNIMKKFILLIDSLVQTFSIIEAGSEIAFKYQNKNNLDVFQEISIGDIILGCFSDPSQMVKCVFEVTKVLDLAQDFFVLNHLHKNYRSCFQQKNQGYF